MQTVLITGASSGYGLETARNFHDKGWTVIAAMRTPREDLLPKSDRIRVVALDVTNADSIAAAVDAAGPIDVLINNAGIGMFGAFEVTPIDVARQIFETNTFGVMAISGQSLKIDNCLRRRALPCSRRLADHMCDPLKRQNRSR